MKMPTKRQVREAGKDCPDAKAILEKLFPEAFEEEEGWNPISLGEMELQEREGKSTGEVGVMFRGSEDYFMPYNVVFEDVWGGDRKNGNPLVKDALKKHEYKLMNGRIYRKKR